MHVRSSILQEYIVQYSLSLKIICTNGLLVSLRHRCMMMWLFSLILPSLSLYLDHLFCSDGGDVRIHENSHITIICTICEGIVKFFFRWNFRKKIYLDAFGFGLLLIPSSNNIKTKAKLTKARTYCLLSTWLDAALHKSNSSAQKKDPWLVQIKHFNRNFSCSPILWKLTLKENTVSAKPKNQLTWGNWFKGLWVSAYLWS